MKFRRCLTGLAVLCLATSASTAAFAQKYPDKPVHVIVPYAPGGPTDIVARVVADKLTQMNGTTFIVENKPGAGANIGAELAARAPGDGYTLLVATATHAINVTLFKDLKYDLVKDFAPVTLLTSGPLVLVMSPQIPAKDVKELVALAKAKPGTLSYASSGNGASTHLAGEMFRSRTGIDAIHVPYKGSGPALTDVMGGQASFMFDTMISAMPFVKGGKLKALAVTSLTRSPAAPHLPTVAESGLPGFEATAWNGLFAPAKTSPEIVARLNADLKKVLAMPDVKEKFSSQGFTAEWKDTAAFDQFVKAEIKKWGTVVKESNAKVD
jgi:tripartite-type tricarboxylate transporter receptor subunit TctC